MTYSKSFSSSLTLNFKSKNVCNRACFIWTSFAIITSSFGKLEGILNDVYQVVQFFSDFELQVKDRLQSCLFHLHRLCNRNFFIRKLEGILNDVYQVVQFFSDFELQVKTACNRACFIRTGFAIVTSSFASRRTLVRKDTQIYLFFR